MNCERARQITHRVLDEELMDAGMLQEHDEHLQSCSLCREHAGEVGQVQQALRALPAVPMTEEALAEVRRRTTRAGRLPRYWQWTAAAAVFGVAVLGTWLWTRQPPEPTAEELARAADETRIALGLASQALRKTQQVGIRGVLSNEVAPALRRLPLTWPEAPSAKQRKDKDDV